MRRVLSPTEFADWLKKFMPQLPTKATADWLPIVVSPDPSDPKLAHLDGLNLSRAWMLEGILSALPAKDARRPALAAAAEAHRRAGLAAVTGEHYEGGHWLGSFAVYLVTQRGVSTFPLALAHNHERRTLHGINPRGVSRASNIELKPATANVVSTSENDVFLGPEMDLRTMRAAQLRLLDFCVGPQCFFDRITGRRQFAGGGTSDQDPFDDRTFRFFQRSC